MKRWILIRRIGILYVLLILFVLFDLINQTLNDNLYVVNDVPTLMGFIKPATDQMYGILMLLIEMSILLGFVLFSIVLVLAYTYDLFNSQTNPNPRSFEKSIESTLDVLFVFIPTILVLYLLIPSLGFLFNTDMQVETMFTLDVIGNQWYWTYEYNLPFHFKTYNLSMFGGSDTVYKLQIDSVLDSMSQENRLLTVDNRVILPIHTPINLRITSQDVIHSWAVPQLGIKVDAIPGRLMNAVLLSNVTGVFMGQCSELCGVNHAFMPIVVQVVDMTTFIDWCFISLRLNPSAELLNLLKMDLPDETFSDVLNVNIDEKNTNPCERCAKVMKGLSVMLDLPDVSDLWDGEKCIPCTTNKKVITMDDPDLDGAVPSGNSK